MNAVPPANPELPTGLDVDPARFHCCGDEDLVFLRCPACGHIMVFCYECDTLFPDLADPARARGLVLTSESDRVVCPACARPFEDAGFLRPENVGKYLPTAGQVRAAGFAHLLSARRGRPTE
jgi:hypothetical protein